MTKKYPNTVPTPMITGILMSKMRQKKDLLFWYISAKDVFGRVLMIWPVPHVMPIFPNMLNGMAATISNGTIVSKIEMTVVSASPNSLFKNGSDEKSRLLVNRYQLREDNHDIPLTPALVLPHPAKMPKIQKDLFCQMIPAARRMMLK